jgi:hypothetical protein
MTARDGLWAFGSTIAGVLGFQLGRSWEIARHQLRLLRARLRRECHKI